jgi:hypothetical protein
MPSAILDEPTQLQSNKTGLATDPARPVADAVGAKALREVAKAVGTTGRAAQRCGRRAAAAAGRDRATPSTEVLPLGPAIARQSAQLPAFAPLLEELEIAGWSSHRGALSANFHDWLLLEGRVLLVAVGQAVGAGTVDSIEAALIAQAAWASIRAHAQHVRDAGLLVTLANQNLWSMPAAAVQANVAVAMIDTIEGTASLAIAGDCLAWKIRAAATEQLTLRQPPLGAATDFTYPRHSVQLSLRERLVLVADDPHRRAAKLPAAITTTFTHLEAESHRRMLATDAVSLVRKHYENGAEDLHSPASIAAVRRR